MRVVIRADEHLAKYQNQLGALGSGQAARIMAMALNREGDKGRTRVRRALMEQTGIRSHMLTKAIRTKRAGPGRLAYEIVAEGKETNISMFGLKVTWHEGSTMGQIRMLQTVSAAPWNVRRVFPGVFSIKRFDNKVFKREGKGRFPLKAVYGPNLAREIAKAQSLTQFETIAPKVGDEVGRLLGLVLSGDLKLGSRRGFVRS
jgi:hypothetical protein